MKFLYRGKDDERSIWWSWQDLRRGKASGFCKHGRAWLHWATNNLHVEWYFGKRDCSFELQFADPAVGDDAFKLHIGIPFIGSFWFAIANWSFVKRLPGVAWDGQWGNGEREIGFAIHHSALWIHTWINPWDGRPWSFNFDDFIRGRPTYHGDVYDKGEVTISMPEGDYTAIYRLYWAKWTRPRWPWPLVIQRGEIEVRDGVPIPGKGENSWDMEDDKTYSMTCPATNVDELVDKFRRHILDQRQKYGW